jgi:Ras-related protein Rab-7A
MYDVSSPKSLHSLLKWWDEFKERAPVREGEEEDFCCVVVGNKVDVVEARNGVVEGSIAVGNANGGMGENGTSNGHRNGIGKMSAATAAKGKWKVSEEEALSFLEELIPRTPSSSTDGLENNQDQETGSRTDRTQDDASRQRASGSLPLNGPSISQLNDSGHDEEPLSPPSSPPPPSPPVRSESISITINNNKTPSHSPHRHNTTRGLTPQSHSRSATRLSPGSGYGHGTKASVSSLATRESIYHTPSSSYFDAYESARSSPVPFPGGHATSPSDGSGSGFGSVGRGSLGKGIRRTNGRNDSTTSRTSRSSVSSSSAKTITQSLFGRSSAANPAGAAHPPALPTPPPLQPLERRPKLFFTSAKTGEGVNEVFEYVARRVVVKWEWEAREWDEEAEWEGRESDTVRVGLRDGERGGLGMKIARGCCAS